MGKEIEKRWVVKSVPEEVPECSYLIEQSYSNLEPDVRVRKKTYADEVEFIHGVKYKISDISKIEIESNINEIDYERIIKYIGKRPIKKMRYVYNIGNGLKAELDVFVDVDKKVVEVEFNTEDEANSFIKPKWFGEEIKSNYSVSKTIFKYVNKEATQEDILNLFI